MADDSTLKFQITELLLSLGFAVALLEPTGEHKMPDFLATKDGQRFLIEIKSKNDDLEEQEELRRRAGRGEVVSHAEYWGPKNTVSRRVRDAVRQLESLPDPARDFRLIWLHAVGADPQSQWEQFFFTLYGATHIYSLADDSFSRQCYYFHNSAFHRWASVLDGAICATNQEAQLLLNTYSPRYGQLRSSSLVETFGQAVHDPLALEAAGEALIADCAIDRQQPDQVKQFLQEKYKVEMLDHIHVGRFSIFVDLPLEPG